MCRSSHAHTRERETKPLVQPQNGNWNMCTWPKSTKLQTTMPVVPTIPCTIQYLLKPAETELLPLNMDEQLENVDMRENKQNIATTPKTNNQNYFLVNRCQTKKIGRRQPILMFQKLGSFCSVTGILSLQPKWSNNCRTEIDTHKGLETLEETSQKHHGHAPQTDARKNNKMQSTSQVTIKVTRDGANKHAIETAGATDVTTPRKIEMNRRPWMKSQTRES